MANLNGNRFITILLWNDVLSKVESPEMKSPGSGVGSPNLTRHVKVHGGASLSPSLSFFLFLVGV